MAIKINSLKVLEKIVKWLNKTQGRDKLCKMIQYFCLMMNFICRDNEYYSLQFQTLFQSVKDARKLFRLFKSIIEYKKLIEILLDDEDDVLKIFRVLGQVCFFFYWFFDNISIVYKIKLIKGNFLKHQILASIFWLVSLLISVPVCAIQAKYSKDQKSKQNNMLDSIKYAFDIIPATEDSAFLNKFLGLKIHPLLVGAGGFISASISTYQNIKEL